MAKKLIREISPDQMVEAILARRQTLATTLPSTLAEREAETNRAYQLVKDAQEKLSALSNEAANDERQKAKHFVEEQETFRLSPGDAGKFEVGEIHSIHFPDGAQFVRVTGTDLDAIPTNRFDLNKKEVAVGSRLK